MESSALIIAHPGHELCVYGWLEAERPRVFVLTDGSGRSGQSRLDSTTEILSSANAKPGSLYGHFADLDLYAAILNHDFGLFEQVVAELAEAIVTGEFGQVVGDAAEGYNPVHDVCRLIINAAAEIASRLGDRKIINRDFLVFGRHDTYPRESRANAVWLELTDTVFAQKLALARQYPELKHEVGAALDRKMLDSLSAFPELNAEVASVIDALGSEAYRVECLRPMENQPGRNGFAAVVPFYERYGELLVAQGCYEQPIRYHDDILPLAEAIWRFVDAKTLATRFAE